LDPGQEGSGIDAIRARVFWYLYIHEGVTAAIRGGRVHMTQEDLDTFQQSLASQKTSIIGSVGSFTLPGVTAVIPVNLSRVCRLFHACLTGTKARKEDSPDEHKLREAWDGLNGCWEDLDQHLKATPGNELEDTEIFVNSWKMFIYECHNIIRQVLKQRLSVFAEVKLPQPSLRETINRLHAVAEFHCLSRLPDVLRIVRSSDFSLDTSLTRDGLLFAAFLIIEKDGPEEDFALCLSALRRYRWVYSKSETRESTLRSMWQEKRTSGLHSSPNEQLFSSNRNNSPTLNNAVEQISLSNHNLAVAAMQTSRSVSPVSPVSITMGSFDSDGSVNKPRSIHHRSSIHEPDERTDTSSSYRTQTSHERSAPPRTHTLSPIEPATSTRGGPPPSFHKLLN